MCGPLAMPVFQSGGVSRLAYHGGRLLSYLVLGSAAGFLGQAFWSALSWAVPQGFALLFFASTYLLVVLLTSAEGGYPAGLRRRLSPLLRRLTSGQSAGALGLATGFLPCGWLYTFVLAAASFHSLARGAALMLVFWTGTVVWVDAAGLLLQRVQGLRVFLHRPQIRYGFLLVSLILGLSLKLRGIHPHGFDPLAILGISEQGPGPQQLICR